MKNRVATIGLVAFLAVDVALVALALRQGRTSTEQQPLTTVPAATQTSIAPGTGTSTGTGTGSGAATSVPTQSSAGSPAAVPINLLVSALDAQTAWRVTGGSCSAGGASVELTTDGAKTWTRLRSPARAIARVQALDPNRAFVIGAGADCTLRQYATTDQGQTWQAPTALENGWARSLADPSQVVTPKNAQATPCDGEAVIDLARTSLTQAEILCANGDVKVTVDGGQTWSNSGKAPGGVALSNYLEGEVLTTYAVRIVDACDGLQLVRVVEGRNATVVTCVRTKDPKKGQVGLSVSADNGWIVSGTETWLANSGLRGWRRA